MKFQVTLLTIVIVLCIAMFFVGRCTAPKTVDQHQHEVDSLRLRIKKEMTLSAYYQSQAALAYQRGIDAQKVKVVHHTVYRFDTAANHRYRKFVKDSLIKAMFTKDPTMDHSIFSNEVANGVLDLKSENKMLKADDKADSTTIDQLQKAYHAQDSANRACQEASAAKDQLVSVAKDNEAHAEKEAKKQGFLKWIGFGLAAVIAILASTR